MGADTHLLRLLLPRTFHSGMAKGRFNGDPLDRRLSTGGPIIHVMIRTGSLLSQIYAFCGGQESSVSSERRGAVSLSMNRVRDVSQFDCADFIVF